MGIIQGAVRRRLGPPPTLDYGNNAVQVGNNRTLTPTVIGGRAPFTFARTAGTQPGGTSLNTSTGVISGTYNGAQGSSYKGTAIASTFRVTDADGQQGFYSGGLFAYSEFGFFNDGSARTFSGTSGSRGVRLQGAFSSFRLDRINNGSASLLGKWAGPGLGDFYEGDYEVRATVLAGTLASGTANTWLRLSSTRTWTSTGSGFQVLLEVGLFGANSALGSDVFTFN